MRDASECHRVQAASLRFQITVINKTDKKMKKQHLLATPIVFLVSLLLTSTHILAAEDESPVPAMDALFTQEQ